MRAFVLFLLAAALITATGEETNAHHSEESNGMTAPSSDLPPDVKDRVLAKMPSIRDAMHMGRVNSKWFKHLRDPDHFAFVIHHRFGENAAEEAYRAGVRDVAVYKKILDLSGWTQDDAKFAIRGVGLGGNLDKIYEMCDMISAKTGVDMIQEAYVGIARSGNVTFFQSLKSNLDNQNPTTKTRHLMMQEAVEWNQPQFVKYLINQYPTIHDEGFVLALNAALRRKDTGMVEHLLRRNHNPYVLLKFSNQLAQVADYEFFAKMSKLVERFASAESFDIVLLQEIYVTAARVNNLAVLQYYHKHPKTSALRIVLAGWSEAAKWGIFEAFKRIHEVGRQMCLSERMLSHLSSAYSRAYFNAIGKSRAEIQAFIERYEDIPQHIKALSDGVYNGDVDAVRAVLTDSAEIVRRTAIARPFIANAARMGHYGVIQEFLRHGFELDKGTQFDIWNHALKYDIDLVAHLIQGRLDNVGPNAAEKNMFFRHCSMSRLVDNNWHQSFQDQTDFSGRLLLQANRVEDLLQDQWALDKLNHFPVTMKQAINRALDAALRNNMKAESERLQALADFMDFTN